MKKFKTSNGDEWEIKINFISVERVKDSIGVDLMSIVTDQTMFKEAICNPVIMAMTIAELCKKQIESRGIDIEDFAELLKGDPIEHAVNAMIDELIDFFPNSRDRKMAKMIWGQINKTSEMIRDRQERIVTEEALTTLGEKSAAQFDEQYGVMLGLSESTPANTG